jgi:hypothetical protein
MTKILTKIRTYNNFNKTIALTAMFVAVAALMIPPTAMAAIGDLVVTHTPGAPGSLGNGRAVAYDGETTLYYTNEGDANIYNMTTGGVDIGPIPDPGRTHTCGALDYNGTHLICGSYDGGVANYTSIDPLTGVETILFNSTEFGLSTSPTDNCFSHSTNYIDGLAYDASDNTYWTSDDIGEILYHIDASGSLINSWAVPSRAGATDPGCNSGIAISGDFLELSLLAIEPNDSGIGTPEIVKVSKDDPTTVIVRFTPTENLSEGLSIDPNTYAPKNVVWTHEAGTGLIKAYEVQVTRTIGYWKNHSLDTTPYLPISLGDGTDVKDCQMVDDATEVRNVLKAHKGQDIMPKLKAQLLAAKLNVALDSIPADDLAFFNGNITNADTFIASDDCDPDTGKKGDDRQEGQDLHDNLDYLNNKYGI